MARHEGRSGGAARSGVRQEKKQSAKGLTCLKCGKVGHIWRHCHKGRSQGSAQSADGDYVRGGRPGARDVGRNAAVGLAAVEAALEIEQQRVEMPPL